MLSIAANTLVRVLLAPACAACRQVLARPLDSPVCAICWAAIPRLAPPLCDLCGDALPSSAGPFRVCSRCLGDPPLFEAARSAGLYAGSLRAIIHAFKYDHRRTLAAPLAALMRTAGADILATADAVVPVPLHPWRSMRRGFNQADDLTRYLGLPVWRLLRRARYGTPQTRLSAPQRRANVRHAFAHRVSLAPGITGTGLDRLQHRTVVLIDDVMTTGATLNACSQVLLDAGVGSVRALTVARAPAPPHPPRQHSPHP